MKIKPSDSKWFALIVVLTAPLLYVIDIFIINIAISDIQKGVHGTNGQVQLVIAGYLLGSASFLITGGRAGDYLGRKKVFFGYVFFYSDVMPLWPITNRLATEHHPFFARYQLRFYDTAGYRFYTGAVYRS